MEPIEAEGHFRRIHNKLPYFATVTVEITEAETGPEIVLACTAGGGQSQGEIEEVPAVGYDDWKQGAVAGVRHALSIANRPNCRVVITRITGMETDTNPTIVGAAAMNAVWQALGYQPSDAERERIEEIVFSSWELSEIAPANYRR